VLRDDGTSQAVMRLVGHDDSEITGPAVSPDGTRLYFSSQRGTAGKSEEGITFEVLLPTKLVE
jgi:secreted PhoX family phosphatase